MAALAEERRPAGTAALAEAVAGTEAERPRTGWLGSGSCSASGRLNREDDEISQLVRLGLLEELIRFPKIPDSACWAACCASRAALCWARICSVAACCCCLMIASCCCCLFGEERERVQN